MSPSLRDLPLASPQMVSDVEKWRREFMKMLEENAKTLDSLGDLRDNYFRKWRATHIREIQSQMTTKLQEKWVRLADVLGEEKK